MKLNNNNNNNNNIVVDALPWKIIGVKRNEFLTLKVVFEEQRKAKKMSEQRQQSKAGQYRTKDKAKYFSGATKPKPNQSEIQTNQQTRKQARKQKRIKNYYIEEEKRGKKKPAGFGN